MGHYHVSIHRYVKHKDTEISFNLYNKVFEIVCNFENSQ